MESAGSKRADRAGQPEVLGAAAALRWSRPDLTAALAEHLQEVAVGTADRDLWLGAAAWRVHAASATGDGREAASEALEGLDRWGATALHGRAAHRLRIELAVVADEAGRPDAAQALLAPLSDDDPDRELAADAAVATARCLLDDDPAETDMALRAADAAWARMAGPRADIGAASVALLWAATERRRGRAEAAVQRAVDGLARLDQARGEPSAPTPSGHLAAALAAEWISSLIDAGRMEQARDGCAPLRSRLNDAARASRQLARLRLTVARATAASVQPGETVQALERAAQDAAAADAPDLEAVCRSALGELHEAAGQLESALESIRLGVVADRRHRARTARVRTAIDAAEALWRTTSPSEGPDRADARTDGEARTADGERADEPGRAESPAVNGRGSAAAGRRRSAEEQPPSETVSREEPSSVERGGSWPGNVGLFGTAGSAETPMRRQSTPAPVNGRSAESPSGRRRSEEATPEASAGSVRPRNGSAARRTAGTGSEDTERPVRPVRPDGQAETANPWMTGQWSTEAEIPPATSGRETARVQPQGLTGSDPDVWLATALAELDRLWGKTVAGGSQETPPPARSELDGCVVVIDLVREGRRLPEDVAEPVVRQLAAQLTGRLPAGARLRDDCADAISVVFPGQNRAAASEWMYRVVPELVEGVDAGGTSAGALLRAAVHDADGVVGAQVLQRLRGAPRDEVGVARSSASNGHHANGTNGRRTGSGDSAAPRHAAPRGSSETEATQGWGSALWGPAATPAVSTNGRSEEPVPGDGGDLWSTGDVSGPDGSTGERSGAVSPWGEHLLRGDHAEPTSQDGASGPGRTGRAQRGRTGEPDNTTAGESGLGDETDSGARSARSADDAPGVDTGRGSAADHGRHDEIDKRRPFLPDGLVVRPGSGGRRHRGGPESRPAERSDGPDPESPRSDAPASGSVTRRSDPLDPRPAGPAIRPPVMRRTAMFGSAPLGSAPIESMRSGPGRRAGGSGADKAGPETTGTRRSDAADSAERGPDDRGADGDRSEGPGSLGRAANGRGPGRRGSETSGSDTYSSDLPGGRGSGVLGSDGGGSDRSDERDFDPSGSGGRGSDLPGGRGSDERGPDALGSDSRSSRPRGSDASGSDDRSSDRADARGPDRSASNGRGSNGRRSGEPGSTTGGTGANGSAGRRSGRSEAGEPGSGGTGSGGSGSGGSGSADPDPVPTWPRRERPRRGSADPAGAGAPGTTASGAAGSTPGESDAAAGSEAADPESGGTGSAASGKATSRTPESTEGLGLAELLAGALAAYRGI